MRKTSGKEALEPVLFGDENLSAVLLAALQASGEVDRFTHGFHTYPAGLHPDGAALLVEALPGESVFDPFCGGGTVLVEAMAHGRRAVGRDISPTAVRVARARTAIPDDPTLTRIRSRARKLTEEARSATALPKREIRKAVEEWYAPHVLSELESLRQGIAVSDEDIRPMLEALFSSILIKVSWRQSDTSPTRVKHKRPPGTTAILFHKKARELARHLVALRDCAPAGTPPADVRFGDARNSTTGAPVHLVLTSPPYPSTYDYLALQHLRGVWFEEILRPAALEREIGSRANWRAGGRGARKQWAEDTHAWTAAAAEALEPGGHLVVVIGDGLGPAGAIDTSGPTDEAAHAAGLTSVARASVGRPDHARQTTRWEHVFAFRK